MIGYLKNALGYNPDFFAEMCTKVVLNICHVHNIAGRVKITRTSLQTGSEKIKILLLNSYFEQTTAEIRKTNHRFLNKIARTF